MKQEEWNKKFELYIYFTKTIRENDGLNSTMISIHTIWLNSTMICIGTILHEYCYTLNIYFLNLIYGTKLDALIFYIEINLLI